MSGIVRIVEGSGSGVWQAPDARSAHDAGLAVPHQHRHGDPAWACRRQGRQLQVLILTESLQLVATVLEPDLHLLRRQLQQLGQLVAFRSRQVALLLESRLQFVDLKTKPKVMGFLLLLSLLLLLLLFCRAFVQF